MDLLYIALLVLAYLSGSISTAILVCKLLTLPDPRIVGSGNPGATNVHRIGGPKAALATLLGDILKTAVPVFLADYLGYSAFDACWVGVSALLGHCFPVFYRLNGGKGVASMFAILILVLPQLALLAIIGWLLTAWAFRRSSVASLFIAVLVPIFAHQFYLQLFLPVSALSLVVILRHRKNVFNILQGKEPLIKTERK